MKKRKVWLTIPIYWCFFFLYSLTLDSILPWFPYSDFVVGSNRYHYGPCSFSITISLILLILGIVYVRKKKTPETGKKQVMVVIGVLILSFVLQIFYYLNHFSYFYLFGIVLG